PRVRLPGVHDRERHRPDAGGARRVVLGSRREHRRGDAHAVARLSPRRTAARNPAPARPEASGAGQLRVQMAGGHHVREYGRARGGSRTPTPFRAPDPKSGASAVPPLSPIEDVLVGGGVAAGRDVLVPPAGLTAKEPARSPPRR